MNKKEMTIGRNWESECKALEEKCCALHHEIEELRKVNIILQNERDSAVHEIATYKEIVNDLRGKNAELNGAVSAFKFCISGKEPHCGVSI